MNVFASKGAAQTVQVNLKGPIVILLFSNTTQENVNTN